MLIGPALQSPHAAARTVGLTPRPAAVAGVKAVYAPDDPSGDRITESPEYPTRSRAATAPTKSARRMPSRAQAL
jgi:hypothetical protein